MKAFHTRLVLFLLLQLVFLIVIGKRYSRHAGLPESYLAASIDKQNLLRTQAPPRFVFVGGSAMAFGIESARVAGAFGAHPVNMGLLHALGLDYMLREAERGVRPGDVVVISPEYETFHKLFLGDSEAQWRLLEANPAAIRLLSPTQIKRLLDSGLSERVGMILRNEFSQWRKPARPPETKTTNIYRRSAFNADGDMIAHVGLAGRGPAAKLDFSHRPEVMEQVLRRLNDFEAFCRAHRIRVYFTHPPLAESYYQAAASQLLAIETDLVRSLRIPMLESVEAARYPDTAFFDTSYHLLPSEARQRSDVLIQRLSAYLSPGGLQP